jgi:predicted dehydrogenase
VTERRAAIGVVGAGWFSNLAHLPALTADSRVDLVAVCDADPARAEQAARRFDIPHTFSNAQELFALEGLDGVIIATPHTTHFALAYSALRAGLDVLVEKPLTTVAAEAWQLVELARELDRILIVGSTYQYTDAAPRIRRAVQRDIGELVAVNAEFSSGTLSLFSTTGGPADNADEPGQPHGSTYSDPSLSGGGQGHSQLSHLLGLLLWTTGDQATDVFARMENRGITVDIVDAMTFRLEGGALCVASSTGTTPPGVPSRQIIRYHGTEGMVEHDFITAEGRLYSTDGTTVVFENPPGAATYPLDGPAGAFVRMILDRTDIGSASGAAASVALLDAAYESARTGGAVEVLRGSLDPSPFERTAAAHD